MRLDKALKDLGYKPLNLDRCMYVLRDKSNKLQAIVSTHVDDLKCAGDQAVLQSIIRAMEKLFGKCSAQWDDFMHCGIHHKRHADGSVTLDHNHYVHQIKPMSLSKTSSKTADKWVK